MRAQGIGAGFNDSLYLFFLLGMVFIPFPLNIFQVHYTDAVFGKLIMSIAHHVPGLPFHNPSITSDSSAMYLLALILFCTAILVTGLLSFIGIWRFWRERFIVFTRTLMAYYLAMMLLKYGFDKLFKQQFYLPEPNTLYTPLGQLHRDLAYWSVMGTSRAYSVFLGICEIILAVLILFRMTRGIGLLASTLVLANIAAINFGFDISVKLYSLFLLGVSLKLGYPYFVNYYQLIINRINANLKCGKLGLKSRRIYVFLKVFAIGLVFIEALYPYAQSGNYNDDAAMRPPLHGAYLVKSFVVGSDTINMGRAPQMLFFHRHGYLIFRFGEDKFMDYAVKVDTGKHQVLLTDYFAKSYTGQYAVKDDLLYLDIGFDEPWHIVARMEDWKKVPLLNHEFHWTVDGVDSGGHN